MLLVNDAKSRLENADRAVGRAEGLVTLLSHFTSIGSNCEFGFVQRHSGAEPMGLLRFGGMPFPQLLRALGNDFAGFDDPDGLEIVAQASEYVISVPQYEFRYHTHIPADTNDARTLMAIERRKIRVLRKQLLDDLRQGNRIFVYQSRDPLGQAEIRALRQALSRYVATLLWVLPARTPGEIGSVQRIESRFLIGYVARLAPRDSVHEPHLESWRSVCRAAYRLWQDDRVAADGHDAPELPGTIELRFGKSGNASACQGQGWSEPEDNFTWSIGKESQLTLRHPGMTEALLSLSVHPNVDMDLWPTQKLIVLANGFEVGAFSLSAKAQLQCVLPPHVFARSHGLVLQFRHPDAVAPSRISSVSRDGRQLAFCFDGLQLMPL